ncbi:LPS export ABC transporter permease LptF [Cereibacter sphaeroides]|uniref:LPS export ABC transporter permease LptF n=1 Tax=Cereibacter sphaeroides TaxID=1063 RepID=UPI001F1F8406|nr:LPS export ABC transporter permease LptF [Cereibacter sphaeroides]MCE6962064.1 LPS export ABC transporter permease LptF [Cereibacter sphaeroides]MCE6975565.1 LPS export ABC transporter permease LptF [Cereibacter sphaeroides]
MSKFDRYLLSQLVALFGFFSLVLVLVYWINRAVGLFDDLISDGQSALVFLEFSLLALPNVIRLVLPLSAFAATIYVVNRLSQESELVVMQATGFSAFRLARPVVSFGLIVALMMLVLMNVLVPASRAILAARSAEISENATARFLRDGEFLHPADGVTLYIREISDTGELMDLFLADDRHPLRSTVYTARRALLVRTDTTPKLLMIDGSAQTLTREGRRLDLTRFDDVTYDLGSFVTPSGTDRRGIEELSTRELFSPTEALLEETRSTRAAFLYEAHSRIAQPFLGLASSLIGFAALLLGSFSRFGLWWQILFAVVLLILVQTINVAASGAGIAQDALWLLAYAAPLTGLAIGVLLLWNAQRPRRLRRAMRGIFAS